MGRGRDLDLFGKGARAVTRVTAYVENLGSDCAGHLPVEAVFERLGFLSEKPLDDENIGFLREALHHLNDPFEQVVDLVLPHVPFCLGQIDRRWWRDAQQPFSEVDGGIDLFFRLGPLADWLAKSHSKPAPVQGAGYSK